MFKPYWFLFAGRSPFGRARSHGATDSLCRASACGATVWPRWRPEPALRRDGDDVTLPVAPHALARQACPAMRAGATWPMSWAAGPFSPTLPFLPSLHPDHSASRVAGSRRHPPDPPKLDFLGEKVRGIVPHPSPKVLPLISHRLTVCISSYLWFFY